MHADDEAVPDDPVIRLDQFLKYAGLADTGGEAKTRIQVGEVRVNGEVETRRGRKLRIGDEIEIDGETYDIAAPGE